MMKAFRFLATDMMEAEKMLMSAGQSVFYVEGGSSRYTTKQCDLIFSFRLLTDAFQ